MLKHSLPPDFCLPHKATGERGRRVAFKPEGVKYPDVGRALETMGKPAKQWTYTVPWSKQATWVLRFDKNGSKKIRVITQYKGGWYVDQMPPVPYPLYRRNDLLEAETVYVCEGEAATNGAWALGFVATTSLGGPFVAALSDWSPLEEKHVVILRDFDDKGLKYAEDVAQLVLAAGAWSAKIVTLPGLKEGEGIHEWIGGRDETEGTEGLKADIEAMALAAPRVERQARQVVQQSDLASRAELQCLSEVVPETLEWVWEQAIPQGALTLVTGEPGIGKSLFSLEVAAAVTRGDRGPREETQAVPAAVILFGGQDDLAKIVRPRLEAAGANVSLVYALNGRDDVARCNTDDSTKPSCRWDRQLSVLEDELQRLEKSEIAVRLIVIDPIRSFVAAAEKGFDVDQAVSRLTELAARWQVAILAIADVAPLGGGTSLFRGKTIDAALARGARSVWMVVRDLDNPKRRLLLPVKTNLCPAAQGLAYTVCDSVVQWEAVPVAMTGDEFVAQATERLQTPVDCETEIARAVRWLRDQLSDGPVPSIEIKRDASENDIKYGTLRRALYRLDGQTGKDKETGKWYWCLPAPESISEPNSQNDVAQICATSTT